ncbi:unnamed protein product [Lepidochelys kempii]
MGRSATRLQGSGVVGALYENSPPPPRGGAYHPATQGPPALHTGLPGGWAQLMFNSLFSLEANNAPRGAAGPDAFTIPRLCRDDSRRVRISHEPMYPAACGPRREGQGLAISERGELPPVPAVLMRLGTEML